METAKALKYCYKELTDDRLLDILEKWTNHKKMEAVRLFNTYTGITDIVIVANILKKLEAEFNQ